MESHSTKINFRDARPADAPLIARAIIMAVGAEITLDFAGAQDRIPLVERLFTNLALRADSQYSYLNTIVAESTENGEVAGLLISYDGARLHPLREAFLSEAAEILGEDLRAKMQDETDASEIYLDTLAVFEPYRRRGIAAGLLRQAAKRHASSGKPLGLLVDKTNPNAARLYYKVGFENVGERPFAGVLMDHLQKKTEN